MIDCDDTFCQLFDPACTGGGGATEVDCVSTFKMTMAMVWWIVMIQIVLLIPLA